MKAMDDARLRERGLVIAFAMHGRDEDDARLRLQIRKEEERDRFADRPIPIPKLIARLRGRST